MEPFGHYEVLSHVELPECSIRIVRVRPGEEVASHYHRECAQIYTVLEGVVEVRIGESSYRLLPYETVRVEKGTVHGVNPLQGPALLLSISIPPLKREDHHPAP